MQSIPPKVPLDDTDWFVAAIVVVTMLAVGYLVFA